MPSIDPLAMFRGSIATFDAKYAAMFAADGEALYKALALILIVWAGTQIALSGSVDMSKLVKFIFVIALGFSFVRSYGTGGEYSIPSLMQAQSDYIVNKIDRKACAELQAVTIQMFGRVPEGNISDGISSFVTYWAMAAFYGGLNVVLFVVIIYGLIALKIVIMLGPFFIPWFIVPKLDFLFWGWLKAVIHFSFYQVVAAAVAWIVTNAFTKLAGNMLDALSGGPGYEMAGINAITLMMYCAVAMLCLIKIPQLTASLFSGGGGDGGITDLVSNVVGQAKATATKAAAVAAV